MNLFGFHVRFPSWRRNAWWRRLVLALGLVALCLAIWTGGPMTGWEPASRVGLRAGLIGGLLGLTLLVLLLRWRRRVRAARQIEDALLPVAPVGDAKVLAEKMQGALAVLKKSGGATTLYDLPWYVIIGPPGAGKTTALANSGLEFPLAQDHAVAGFGGTRNVDFWFAEDAVLIDTAGRYTTQDSDSQADKSSWTAFLDLLKRTRPHRPINGVILSFSVEELMQGDAASLAAHAETVRARLAELHEQLKIDFPVYVMFTKADLIAGFREYFASFSLNRRKLVWGVTFQTKDRKAITHEAVPAELDRLVARLSDEIIDRLSEEPDGVARIAIFGLPGQMALLRDNLADFMRRVFEPTRYKTNAILRGFYFTSGTQEGTPIDQVLGAMAQPGAPGSFASGFMSGRGKSYFIHGLLRDVIFPEQGWVSHDRKAVRRALLLRTAVLGAIAVMLLGGAGALGYSYWKNLTLVRTAEAEAQAYSQAAFDELHRAVIDDTDLRPIVPLLNDLKDMPAGYGDSERPGFFEGLGLGQRDRLARVTVETYVDALERMLRPRLILDLEQRMPQIIASGDMTNIYRALKVYLLLGKQGQSTDDPAILSWFDQIWREDYPGRTGLEFIDQLKGHLQAMLALDDRREVLVDLDQNTVDRARAAIAQLPMDEQAYAIIMDGALAAGLQDWNLAQAVGNGATQVFATRDGGDLSALSVPGLYTYEGFWGYFFDQLDVVGEQLRRDQWVLGEQGSSVEIERRLARLDRDLMERYRTGFITAWNDVLGNLTLASMVADKPVYAALGTAASASGSPLLALVKAVDEQTYLSREYEQLDGVDLEAPQPDSNAGGVGVGDKISNQLLDRMKDRSGPVQRILLDEARQRAGKSGVRAGAAGEASSVTAPIEAIAKAFENWHMLVLGETGQRPIDTLLGNLGAVWNNLKLAEFNPESSAAALPTLLNTLTQYNSQLPAPLSQMVSRAESDFRAGASDASIETMNRALSDRITFICRDTITSSYPFGDASRSLSIDNFSRFFGPGGAMDSYFTEYLEPYVERTPDGLSWRADKQITQRMSANTLMQFQRAERIRRAFFAGGGSAPSVEITVAQADANPTIESALLTINDEMIPTTVGSLPRTIIWPGSGRSTMLQLSPPLDRQSALRFEGSPWTLIDFMNAATSTEQRGDTLRVRFNVGGRNITYDFTINAITNPFTMPEIRDFECPQSID